MIYQQFRDLAPVFGLLTNRSVLSKETARTSFCRADPSLTSIANQERPMATNLPTAWSPSAQYQDPLITNARLVNLAAEIERNLAARRALRPIRSEAARKGWGTRRDR